MNFIGNEKNKAIMYIVASAFFFTWMNIFVRMSGDLPSIQKSFFRNLVAAIIAIILIVRSGDGFHPQKKNLPGLVMRSVFGTLGIFCNFYAVDHLLLSNASMLNKMSPFFVLVFSYFILRERMDKVQVGLVVLAFVGSMFVVKPNFANAELFPSAIGFAGGAFAGLAYTMVRKVSLQGEKGSTIVIFFSSFSCLSVLPWMLLKAEPMTLAQFITLLGAGAAAAGGQFTITAAYSHAPGKEVSIYDYSQIIFAALFGFFLFGDVPDMFSIAGYVLIVGAAVILFLYNNRPTKET